MKERFVNCLRKWSKLTYHSFIAYTFISFVCDSMDRIKDHDNKAYIWTILTVIIGALWIERLYSDIEKQVKWYTRDRIRESIEDNNERYHKEDKSENTE